MKREVEICDSCKNRIAKLQCESCGNHICTKCFKVIQLYVFPVALNASIGTVGVTVCPACLEIVGAKGKGLKSYLRDCLIDMLSLAKQT